MASHLCLDMGQLFGRVATQSTSPGVPSACCHCVREAVAATCSCTFCRKSLGARGPALWLWWACVLEGHDYRWLGSHLPEEWNQSVQVGVAAGRWGEAQCSQWWSRSLWVTCQETSGWMCPVYWKTVPKINLSLFLINKQPLLTSFCSQKVRLTGINFQEVERGML